MRNWFAGYTDTVERVKKRFRALAKDHHPDLGGDLEKMQAINAQYAAALARLDKKTFQQNNGKQWTYHYNPEKEEKAREDLISILKINGLEEVSLVGTWIWIKTQEKNPDTIKALKSVGCRWHGKRKLFYKKPEGARRARYSGQKFEQLAERYGVKKYRPKSGGEVM